LQFPPPPRLLKDSENMSGSWGEKEKNIMKKKKNGRGEPEKKDWGAK